MISNPLPWPSRKRCAVAITWDLDADSGLRFRHSNKVDNLVATQSLLRYGPSIAVPRLMKVLKQLELTQTFFVPGWVIKSYPAAIDLILEHGHEIGLHGYMHEHSNKITAEEEREVLARAVECYVARIGGKPRGWRAPGFAFSRYSLSLLVEHGFDYDSSLMGNDIPYIIKNDTGQLLEFPTDWTFDDWPYYMHNRDFEYMLPICSPEEAIDSYRVELEAARQFGALLVTVWHPFLSGRLSRLYAIEKFLQRAQEFDDVWLTRLDHVYDHVRSLIKESVWQPEVEQIPVLDPGS